jgi:hypothetical protein
MGQQSAVLRHVPDVTAKLDNVELPDVPTAYQHPPGIGSNETVEAPEQSSFAGAALTNQRDAFALGDVESHAVERHRLVESLDDGFSGERWRRRGRSLCAGGG